MIPSRRFSLNAPSIPLSTSQHRVLRNTYALLALSMLPTIAGAWLGLSTGIASSLTGVMSVILFIAAAFGFIYAIEKTKHSGVGVLVLLGFTFFMGLMMSHLLSFILGFRNGAELIMIAFTGTAGIFVTMATLASTLKKDLSHWQQWLTMGAVVLLIGFVVQAFVSSPALLITLSMMAVLIFSAFLLFDLRRIITGGETNYITATLSVYLSLINIFQNLLTLLGIFGGEKD